MVLEGILAALDLFFDLGSDYWSFAVASEVLAPFVALIVGRQILKVLGVIKH